MIVAFVMFAMVEYAAIVITDFDYIYTRKVIDLQIKIHKKYYILVSSLVL